MGLVRDLVRLFFEKKVTRAAAQLAYYLILSIFPLLICINAMLGRLNLSETALLEDLQSVIPAAAYEIIMDYLVYVSENSSGTMLLMALVVLLTSSSAGFRTILTVMAEIQDEHRFIGFRKGVSSVLLSLAFLLAIYVSCIVIVTGNWFIRFVTEYTGWSFFAGLWSWLRFVILFVLLLGIVYGIYRLSAPKEKPRRQRALGALAAALALVGASVFFSWTIALSAKYPVIYGSLASIIILMLWLFLCGNILILGNVFNVVFNRYRARRRYIRRRSEGGNAGNTIS